MEFMIELFTTENMVAFVTLTFLEIILGIDNIIFIAILAGRLPPEKRDFARQLGISMAVISRLVLLFSISWVMSLKNELFRMPWFGHDHSVAGKDLILLGGGLFLMYKATKEIYHKVEGLEHGADSNQGQGKRAMSLSSMLVQVMIIDVVFSLDSVITAVGMCKSLPVMIASILCSVVIMLVCSKMVVTFIDKHPTIKVLALSFLLMIGVLLVAESFHQEIPKGYIYFAMFFSLSMDLLQIRMNKKHASVHQNVTELNAEKSDQAGT
jgi:predicted tellurium resistance membrane protein TerC